MHSQALSKTSTRYSRERPAGRGGCWSSRELPWFGGMRERSAATVGKAGELAASCPGSSLIRSKKGLSHSEQQKIMSPQGTGKDPLLLGPGKKKPLLLVGDKTQS